MRSTTRIWIVWFVGVLIHIMVGGIINDYLAPTHPFIATVLLYALSGLCWFWLTWLLYKLSLPVYKVLLHLGFLIWVAAIIALSCTLVYNYVLPTNSFFATTALYIFGGGCWYIVTKLLGDVSVPFYKELMYTGLIMLTLLLGVEACLRFLVRTKMDHGEKASTSLRSKLYDESQAIYYTKPSLVTHVSYQNSEFTHTRKRNTLGLSEKNVPAKDENEIRFLCLGDSFTEGAGVDYEFAWPRVTEKMFNQTCEQYDFLFVNAGLSGNDPFFECHLFEKNLVQYESDWVIMMVNNSDIYDFIERGGMERFNADGSVSYKKAPWWYPAYRYSYIVRHVAHDIFKLTPLLVTQQKQKELDKAGVVAINKIGKKLENLGKQVGFEFVLVLQPTHFEVTTKRYRFANFSSITNDLEYSYDLLPYMINQTEEGTANTDYFWPVDGHFNKLGYKLVGEGIYEYLTTVVHENDDCL